MHPWWPHLFSWPRFLDPISWTWLSVKGYAFTSSGEQVSFVVGVVVLYRHHVCGAPRCWRLGKHPTADGMHHLCARHHPDLPDQGRLSLAQIVERHHAAKNR